MGLIGSGGDFQAALKGGGIGALTGGLASFLPAGTIGDMVGSGINGALQTGDLKGFARGLAAGIIPKDLGFEKAYREDALANVAIGIARDGIRGSVVGGKQGALRGAVIGRFNNAIGHLTGLLSATCDGFRDGTFYYQSGRWPNGAITFGNVIRRCAARPWLVRGELHHHREAGPSVLM